MAPAPRNVLFLCTDNARESLVAEAILREVGALRFRAYSGGVIPAARPARGLLEFLESRRLAVSALRPKDAGCYLGGNAPLMDFVFALSHPAAQLLPRFSPRAVTAQWNVEADEIRDVFWTLMRRIKIFTALLERPSPQQRVQERLHAIAAWH